MKQKLLIALIAAATIVPVAAQAQSYVGANIGRGEQKVSVDAGSVEDHDTAFKLYAGYQFNKNFGIEGGHADLGKWELSGESATFGINPRSFYLAATGTVTLPAGFALFGKVGAAKTRNTLSATDSSDEKINKTSLLLGVGASYAITPAVAAVLEFERFGNVIDEDGFKLKANLLSAGVRFKF